MGASAEHRCIFVHVPKTAGTSISALVGSDDGHMRWSYYAKHHPEAWASYLRFAVVRNPFARAVSTSEFVRMGESHWHASAPDERRCDTT